MTRHSVFGWSGALVASALALMVAACGSSTGSTSAASPGDTGGSSQTGGSGAATSGAATGTATQGPCDLLAQADVEAAIGQPTKADAGNGQAGMCGYHSTDNAGFGVSITVGPWDSIQAAARAGTKPPDPVTGIGDEALTIGHGGPLYVRVGSQGFLLMALSDQTKSSPDGVLAMEKELSQKVATKLK